MREKDKDDHDRITIIETQLKDVLGFGKVVITICITATLSIIGMLWNFGMWLYDNSGPVKAGIAALLKAKGNGQ